MNLVIAIPCLNEENTIAEVIKRIPKVLKHIKQIIILVVDDGSTDDTAKIASESGAVVIRHPNNRGVGAAFNTAVNYAIENRFDIMVNIDGDGQFSPEDIPKIVYPIVNREADLVTASRFIDKAFIPKMPRVKYYGNNLMSFLISKLTGTEFHDVSCGFRAYSRETLLQMNLHGLFTYTQETFLDLISKKMRIIEVPIHVQYFQDRKSRVASSIIHYAINTLQIILRVYRDYFPFKFFLSIAGVFFVIAVFFGSVFMINFFKTGRFSGFLFAGFTSAFFLMCTLVFSFAAIFLDMFVRIRLNQERILYNQKKNQSVR